MKSTGALASTHSTSRIELLMVGKSLNAAESMFGHVALLIAPANQSWHLARIYHFMASLPEDESNLKKYTKSFVGQYKFSLASEAPEVYFFKNAVKQGRSITRYPLLLPESVKNNLIALVDEYEKHPEKLGDYYFSHRNCAYMLAWLFQKAGLPINLMQYAFGMSFTPEDLIQRFDNVLIMPWPGVPLDSVATKYGLIRQRYQSDFLSELDNQSSSYLRWSPYQVSKLEHMSYEDLAIISQVLNIFDVDRKREIVKIIKRRFPNGGHVNWTGFQSFPVSIYGLCDNLECVKTAGRDVSISNDYQLKNVPQLMAFNSYKLKRSKNLAIKLHPDLILHWSLFSPNPSKNLN